MRNRVGLVLFLSAVCVALLSGGDLFARGGGPIGPPVSQPKPSLPGGKPHVDDENRKIDPERAERDPSDALEENRKAQMEKIRGQVLRNCQTRILKSLVDGIRQGVNFAAREVDGGAK